MNSFNKKLQTKLRMHPQMLLNFLANPNEKTVETLNNLQIFESKNIYLGQLLHSLIPRWELLACNGNMAVSELIKSFKDKRLSLVDQEAEFLRSNLLRIRILADTPGRLCFCPQYIQENLLKFLDMAELIADLPHLENVHFSKEELVPLSKDLSKYHLGPLSHRYVQNLFYPVRQEAVLSTLAHLAKNHPLLSICRQAYAIMLSLDVSDYWSHNPFILRLIANRFKEYQAKS